MHEPIGGNLIKSASNPSHPSNPAPPRPAPPRRAPAYFRRLARCDFTACLGGTENKHHLSRNATVGCGPGSPQQDARTLFRRGWANKALGDLDHAAADFEAARRLEPLHPHLSVDYRNIFDTELVVVDDVEPLTQAPALFHSW